MIYLDAPRLSAVAERQSLRYLEQAVADPAIRAKLTPSFQFGCKRILISDDYWQAFNRPNVELVTEAVEELVREGVRTKDGGVRELDAIVFATGFALNIASAPFPVTGRGGRTLGDAWKDGAMAYKGLAVHGFPNWFILMGPNTGPGHTSVLVFTEAQINHAVGAIRKLRDENLKAVEVRRDVQDRYNAGLERRMKHMVWSSGCKSWYLSPDGKNHSLYPGPAAEYALRSRRFRPRDYEIARF
jgi:cation diffusion facilitator CzcD-associated flavoprotein CzcO